MLTMRHAAFVQSVHSCVCSLYPCGYTNDLELLEGKQEQMAHRQFKLDIERVVAVPLVTLTPQLAYASPSHCGLHALPQVSPEFSGAITTAPNNLWAST